MTVSAPRPFVLQRADEAFDDGDAAGFADGAESLMDALPAAPAVEPGVIELPAAAADKMLGGRAWT